MTTLGEAVVRALAEHGVELVFGIPGTHTLELHRHLGAHGIRHITPRHEAGGAYAADGYARVTGRPGVVLATSGPGVINTATAAATAYADSVPMLIVSPSMPSLVEGRDTGFLHESKDQGAAMNALVAFSRTATTAPEALAAIHDAFTLPRPRPVHLQLPLDALKEAVPSRLQPPSEAQPPPAANVNATVPAKSAVVLGGGARGAGEAALALGVPVMTTVNGKGVVDERHPLSLGASLRLGSVQRWLESRELVVAVGTELGESDLWGSMPELKRVIRVDIDPGQLDKNVKAEQGIAGDAREVLERMTSVSGVPEDLGEIKAASRAEALRDGAKWVPLMKVLDDVLGEDGILAGDSTQAAYYGAVHFLPMDARRRFLYPTGYATLGYALPAAIGAKLAAPGRRVIALIGDGGLMFTVAELATAAQLRLPLPVIVPNNRGYGEIRDQMLEEGIEPVGVDLDPPDLPKLADALGARGLRIDDTAELPGALETALGHPGPTLIEVPDPGTEDG